MKPDRFDVEYLHGDRWVYWDFGGDTLSTAERRAKNAASTHETTARVLRNNEEVSRFVFNPRSRASQFLRAKRVKVPGRAA